MEDTRILFIANTQQDQDEWMKDSDLRHGITFGVSQGVIGLSKTLTNLSEDIPEGIIPLPLTESDDIALFRGIILPWCITHQNLIPREGMIKQLTPDENALLAKCDPIPVQLFRCIEIANYLDIGELMEQLCFYLSKNHISGLTSAETRARFGLVKQEPQD